VLEHVNEFMANQNATHLSAHRPLLQGDRAKAAMLGAVGGIFSCQFRLTGHQADAESLSLKQKGLIQLGILLTGAPITRRSSAVIR
jgi:hypothetical protein